MNNKYWLSVGLLGTAILYSTAIIMPILLHAGHHGISDFSWYYEAFRTVWHAPQPGTVLYQVRYQDHWMAVHHFPYSRQNLFAYPPLVAVGFAPLAALPYPMARHLWDGLMIVCLITALGWIGIWATLKWYSRFVVWAVALIIFPIYNNMYWGQINPLVLLLVVISLWLVHHNRDTWGGAVLTLAALVKVTPAIIMVYWLCRGRWKAVLGTLVSLAAIVLLCLPVIGWSPFPTYILHTLPAVSRSDQLHGGAPWNQSILGVLMVLIHPYGLANLLFMLIALSVFGLIVVLDRRLPITDSRLRVAEISLLPLLCSPVIETHHLVLALLPLGLLGGVLLDRPRSLWRGVWLFAWAVAAGLLIVPTSGFEPVIGYSLVGNGTGALIPQHGLIAQLLNDTQHLDALLVLLLINTAERIRSQFVQDSSLRPELLPSAPQDNHKAPMHSIPFKSP